MCIYIDSCRAANKFDCKHNLDKLPAWKPASGQRKVGILMESVPDLYQREVLGEVVNTTQDIFTKVSIDKLKLSKQVEHKSLNEPIIFTAIDPAGGKKYYKTQLLNNNDKIFNIFHVYINNFVIFNYIF